MADVLAQSRSDDVGKLMLRLTVGVLMLFHGVAKIQGGVGFLEGMLSDRGLPAFIAYGVYLGEVVAPILLILGIFSRAAALVLAFDMLMAIVLAFGARAFTLNERSGGWTIELELLFLFGALAVFFLGSGRFALSRGQGRWD